MYQELYREFLKMATEDPGLAEKVAAKLNFQDSLAMKDMYGLYRKDLEDEHVQRIMAETGEPEDRVRAIVTGDADDVDALDFYEQHGYPPDDDYDDYISRKNQALSMIDNDRMNQASAYYKKRETLPVTAAMASIIPGLVGGYLVKKKVTRDVVGKLMGPMHAGFDQAKKISNPHARLLASGGIGILGGAVAGTAGLAAGAATAMGVPLAAGLAVGSTQEAVKQNKLKKQGITQADIDAYQQQRYEAMKAYRDNGYKMASENEAFEKRAESSYLSDFFAGFDPTGVSTFRNAMQNEKNHGTHKAIGNASGFASGAAMGALMPAGLAGGAYLALKGKNPHLAEDMKIMAKGSMDMFNPLKMKRYFSSFKDLSEFKNLGGQVLNDTEDIAQTGKRIQNAVKHKDGEFFTNVLNTSEEDAVKYMKDQKNKINSMIDNSDKLKSMGDDMSKKYYGGMTVPEGAARAFTGVTTLGTAAMGGALNASSSEMQYNMAQQQKQKLREALLKK